MKSNNLTEPKKILFINEKGGVGKTTLVDEMCFEAEAKGIPYSLHNLDPQGTLLHEPHNFSDVDDRTGTSATGRRKSSSRSSQ